MAITRSALHKDKSLFICQSFDFKYSGRVHIHMNCNRKGYFIICEGFRYDFYNRVATFSKDYFFRSKPTTLYIAISQFHFMCTVILNNGMDWFSSDAFDEDVFYRECLQKAFE